MLSEAVTENAKPAVKVFVLGTAVLAAISTALAEIMGGAIALTCCSVCPSRSGRYWSWRCAVLAVFNSYKKIEKIIIGFVSLIGLSFIFEIAIVHIDWAQRRWVG